MKFLIFISIFINLLYARQIILVVANDFNSTTAQLSCIEDGKTIYKNIPVNLGKNGLGWGVGLVEFSHDKNEPIKKEGDKKAPAGIFKLSEVFGYEKIDTKMKFLKATKELICVDDSNSKNYNFIIKNNHKEKSYEVLKRDDNLYKIGIVVEHNKKQIPFRGSCIFLHVQRDKNSATVGCTSMSEENIKKIASWLDKEKNPILIQITKKYLQNVKSIYNIH